MRMNIHRPLQASHLLFKAFADPTRLRILNLLRESDLCVCHVIRVLRLPQSTVSRHFAYLKRAGLVIAWEDGTWNHYRLNAPCSPLHRALLECIGGCLREMEPLKRDRQRIKQVMAACLK